MFQNFAVQNRIGVLQLSRKYLNIFPLIMPEKPKKKCIEINFTLLKEYSVTQGNTITAFGKIVNGIYISSQFKEIFLPSYSRETFPDVLTRNSSFKHEYFHFSLPFR